MLHLLLTTVLRVLAEYALRGVARYLRAYVCSAMHRPSGQN